MANEASESREGTATNGRPQVRVIVAGRTGLEQSLRRDGRVELIRASSGYEAVGELSDPLDDDSPRRSVVIVGPGAVSTDDVASHQVLVSSLRRVDPDASVLLTGADAARAEFVHLYDGETSADRVLTDVMANGEARARSPVAEPQGAMPEASATPGEVEAEFGDERLAQALVSGGDIVPVAIAVLQARLGSDVELISDRGGPADVPVALGERVFGYLRSRSITSDELSGASSWLASWLALSEQHSQLRRAAFTDPLTGAWNRRYLERFLARAMERARGRRRPVTVLVFDIDDFKRFNDRYGHDAGDEILTETVRLLTSVIRPTDRVCRVGGDEFAVVFDEPGGPRTPGSQPPTTVEQIARRFQQQICEHRFPKLSDEAPGTLTISGGLAAFPWDGMTPGELLRAADEFALRSKRAGKNVLTFGPGAVRACESP